MAEAPPAETVELKASPAKEMLAALETPVVLALSVTVVPVRETMKLFAATPVPVTYWPTARPVVLAKLSTALPLVVLPLVATTVGAATTAGA